MDKSDVRFVLDLSLKQISLNPFFRPVTVDYKVNVLGILVGAAQQHGSPELF